MPNVCSICGAPVDHGHTKRCRTCELHAERIPTENEKRVFEAMCRLQCADRDTLTHYTQLARTTVFDALKRLEKEQAVVPFTQNNAHQGRPKTLYILNPQYGELTTAEWRRLQQTTFDLYHFFGSLQPEDAIHCQLSGEVERYGAVKPFCQSQCGVRIACMAANQEAGK